MKLNISKTYPLWLISIFVFLFVFSFTLTLRLTTASFSSGDDPYYHARKSYSVWSGEIAYPPAFSLQTDKPVDLYTLYHKTMGPFVSKFDGTNFNALIIGSKIYHSTVVGLLTTIFFLFSVRILKGQDIKKYLQYAAFGSASLFLLSNIFAFRIFLERPHVFSIIFMLGIVFALVERNMLLALLIAFLFPFFYSVSFLILLPPLIYIFSAFIYRENRLFSIKIFFSTLLGLILGVLARPDTLAYIHNGYLVHFKSLSASIFGLTSGTPSELGYGWGSVSGELLWLVPFIFCFIVFLIYTIRKSNLKNIPFKIWFLWVLATAFVVGYFLVERTVEYTLPLVILTLLASIKILHNIFRDLYSSLRENSFVHGTISEVRSVFHKNKKIFITFIIFFVVVLFISRTVNLLHILKKAPQYTIQLATTEKLREYAPIGSTVFIPRFGMFPELYFYAPEYRYTSGMDPMFTYAHDKEIYWRMYHATRAENICGEKNCIEPDMDTYTFITRTLGANFMIMNEKYFRNSNGTNLKTVIEQDPRFKLIFTDSEFPNMKLYKLETIAN